MGPPEIANPPGAGTSEGSKESTGGHHVAADDTAGPSVYRAKRMAAQRAVARILRADAVKHHPDRWPGDVYRVIHCLWCRSAQVEVVRSVEHNRAHYKGLQTCGSVWHCPCCAAKIEERRRDEISRVFEWAEAQHLDSSLHTNTFPHGIGDGLAPLLKKQAEALRLFRDHRTYRAKMKEVGYVGMVRALELMHGQNGWHPHTHELKFHRESLSQDDWKRVRHDLVEVWRVCCERVGLIEHLDDSTMASLAFYQRSLDIRAHFSAGEYLNKTDDSKNWTPAHELAKASTKEGRRSGVHPFQLAVRGNPRDPELFVEYARAMKGRRKLLFSPGLKKLAGVAEMSDEEIAARDDDAAQLVANVTRVWDFIKATDRQHNTRARVLEVAEANGKDGIAQLLHHLGFDPLTDAD